MLVQLRVERGGPRPPGSRRGLQGPHLWEGGGRARLYRGRLCTQLKFVSPSHLFTDIDAFLSCELSSAVKDSSEKYRLKIRRRMSVFQARNPQPRGFSSVKMTNIFFFITEFAQNLSTRWK